MVTPKHNNPTRPLFLRCMRSVLLLLGFSAVLSLAIAAILAAAHERWPRAFGFAIKAREAIATETDSRVLASHVLGHYRAQYVVPASLQLTSETGLESTTLPSWSIFHRSGNQPVIEDASGWPFLTLRCYWLGEYSEAERRMWYVLHNGIGTPKSLGWADTWGTVGAYPLEVLPRGLLYNTLFYSVVIGSVYAGARRLRSARRVRRGCCATCGYPCLGLQTCPECGATIPNQQKQPQNAL